MNAMPRAQIALLTVLAIAGLTACSSSNSAGPSSKGEVVFLADTYNGRILVTPDVGTTWGSYTAPGNGANQLGSMSGIYVTAAGAIYTTDWVNGRIIRVNDTTGAGWTSFGTVGSGVNQFNSPRSIWVDEANGNKIYVTDALNHRIVRIDDMTGAGWVTFGTAGGGVNQFDSPGGILIGGGGASAFAAGIYVSDFSAGRIAYFSDMTGSGWTTYGTNGSGNGQFMSPLGMAFGKDNKLYIVDHMNYRVVRISDMTGTGWISYGSSGTGTGNFYYPRFIAVDSTLRIYVSDGGMSQGKVVRMDDMTGAGWMTFTTNYKGLALSAVPEGIFLH